MGFFQWVMGLWARECTPLLTNPQRTTRTDDIFQIATRRTDVGKFSVVNSVGRSPAKRTPSLAVRVPFQKDCESEGLRVSVKKDWESGARSPD